MEASKLLQKYLPMIFIFCPIMTEIHASIQLNAMNIFLKSY